MGRRKLTNKEIKEVIEIRTSGISLRAIASAYGISHELVNIYFHYNSKTEYNNVVAKKAGFKSHYDYLNHQVGKKGFKSYAHYQTHIRKIRKLEGEFSRFS